MARVFEGGRHDRRARCVPPAFRESPRSDSRFQGDRRARPESGLQPGQPARADRPRRAVLHARHGDDGRKPDDLGRDGPQGDGRQRMARPLPEIYAAGRIGISRDFHRRPVDATNGMSRPVVSGAVRVAVAASIALIACLWPRPAAAHNVPADVTVRIFVKPDGSRLHYLVRIPMASIIDIEWPTSKPEGTLDLTRIEPFLAEAARMWTADDTDLFEGNRRLEAPALTAVRLSLESDASFQNYGDASASFARPPLDPATRLQTN